MSGWIPTGRGFVNTWQCDENDHLNVQFFTAFADDAAAHLNAALGLGPAALRAAGLSARPREDHVRYHRELRAEDVVAVVSAPVEVSRSELVACHELRNGYDGAVAATVRRVTACLGPDGAPAAWPEGFTGRAAAACVALPANAAPRGAGLRGPLPDLRLEDCDRLGLVEICRDVVQPAECDADGTLAPRFHVARQSDGAAALWHSLGFDRAAMAGNGQGSVVLETKTVYRRPLRAGALVVTASGLLAAADKTLHFAHFLFDAETGALAASGEAIAVLFDQRARRAMALPAEARVRLAHATLRL